MSKTVTIIAVLAIMFLAGILIIHGTSHNKNKVNTSTGELYVLLADTTTDAGEINDVTLITNDISIHHPEHGWRNISNEQKQYSLSHNDKHDTHKLITNTVLPTGTYDRIRFRLEHVEITAPTGTTTKAVLPTHNITFNTSITITEKDTAFLTLDIHTDQSLHTTTGNSFVFLPVITSETRIGSDITVHDDTTVTLTGGVHGVSTTIYTKPNGHITTDSHVSSTTKMKLHENGTINIISGTSTATNTSATE